MKRTLFFISLLFGLSLQAQDSIYYSKNRHKSVGFILTGLCPKHTSFVNKDLVSTGQFFAFNKTIVKQYYVPGIGFSCSRYRIVKSFLHRQLFVSPGITINDYNQKLEKHLSYNYGGVDFFYSNVDEFSFNLVLEPEVNLSYQVRQSPNYSLNFETGLGMNCHIFTYVSTTSPDASLGGRYVGNYFKIPLQCFLKIPLKIESIHKIKGKQFGFAVLSQVNYAYSLFRKAETRQLFPNPITESQVIGFNAPAFVYQGLPTSNNNYPFSSFVLSFQVSRKF